MPVPKKMSELWMWMAVENDGTEGIMAAVLPGLGTTPFVVASRETVERLRDFAVQCARERGITIKLVRFTTMEVVETMPGRSS